MTDREKLIELLYEADRICNNKPCITCKHQDKRFFCKIHFYIDHLIANGVTFATDTNDGGKWISVKDRLPEDLVHVLTCDAKGNIHIMWHYHEYQYPFNIGRKDIRYFPVTHWCYLPQPPKGE